MKRRARAQSIYGRGLLRGGECSDVKKRGNVHTIRARQPARVEAAANAVAYRPGIRTPEKEMICLMYAFPPTGLRSPSPFSSVTLTRSRP